MCGFKDIKWFFDIYIWTLMRFSVKNMEKVCFLLIFFKSLSKSYYYFSLNTFATDNKYICQAHIKKIQTANIFVINKMMNSVEWVIFFKWNQKLAVKQLLNFQFLQYFCFGIYIWGIGYRNSKFQYLHRFFPWKQGFVNKKRNK